MATSPACLEASVSVECRWTRFHLTLSFGSQMPGWLFSFVRVHSPAKLCRAPLSGEELPASAQFVNNSGVE